MVTFFFFFGDFCVLCLSILVRFLQISRNYMMSTLLSIYEGQIQMRWIAQLKLKEIHSFSAFLFYSGTSWIGWCLLAFMKTIFFSQSTHIMLLSSWNTLTDTSRNNVLIAISASLGSLSWHIKLTFSLSKYSVSNVSLICQHSWCSLAQILSLQESWWEQAQIPWPD